MAHVPRLTSRVSFGSGASTASDKSCGNSRCQLWSSSSAAATYLRQHMSNIISSRFPATARVAAAALAGLLAGAASANVPCDVAGHCESAESAPLEASHRPISLAAQVELATLTRAERLPRQFIVPPTQYRTFSGVGAVLCSLDGASQTSTAFLVGRFDIAVTVAHTFLFGEQWVPPENCEYISSGPLGQIRERIPIAELQAQWRTEPGTLGQPDSDLAVIRLSAPARLAQRTLSFTKFSHKHARIALIGYRGDIASDAARRKISGSA